MSCIAGIMNLDGSPVDQVLIERMTRVMEPRAPDAIHTWALNNVGFGHALLRITPESESEQQPCSLDGEVWITGDVRVDARAELISKLIAHGELVNSAFPDVLLVLHAYRAFGDQFLSNLIGDFAFSIWDSRKQELICARDHFGVRPFFYFKTKELFVFASDLDALLQHPAAKVDIDELFIADHLLFGGSIEAEPTVYKNIRRLAAASKLHIKNGRVNLEKYFKLRPNWETAFADDGELLELFSSIFTASVMDRSRGAKISAELSGGLDSTSIAAVVARNSPGPNNRLNAFTGSCQAIFPEDKDPIFAEIAAKSLNIPLVIQSSHKIELFEKFGDPILQTSEPFGNPNLAGYLYKTMTMESLGSRTLLTGEGGDMAFTGSNEYNRQFLRQFRLIKFISEIVKHVKKTGSLAGMGLRSLLITPRPGDWSLPFPEWLDKDFVDRNQLKARWQGWWPKWNGANDCYHQLEYPWVSQIFENHEVLKRPIRACHPFYDIRLVTFLMGLPKYALNNKMILRDAMRGLLPEEVRVRPKESGVGDVLRAKMQPDTFSELIAHHLKFAGASYIDVGEYQSAYSHFAAGEGADSTWSSWLMVAPMALDFWMEYNYFNKIRS